MEIIEIKTNQYHSYRKTRGKETKSWFFKKENKVDESLIIMTKIREKIQIISIKNEMGYHHRSCSH